MIDLSRIPRFTTTTACVSFLVLAACARVRNGANADGHAGGGGSSVTTSADAGNAAPAPGRDASSAGNGGASLADAAVLIDAGMNVSMLPPGASMFLPVPARLTEKLKTLQESDFKETPDAIAKAHCGYVFRVEQSIGVDVLHPDHGVIQQRAFDDNGRLRVAVFDPTAYGKSTGFATRLQFDYDSQGRVTRWRYDLGGGQYGDFAEFAYNADGSFTADMTGTEPQIIWRSGIQMPVSGFCQRMEFDAGGRLLKESWGCEQPIEARVYSYDDKGRLMHVVGHGLLDLFGAMDHDDRYSEPDAWSVSISYADSESTTVWNERELAPQGMVEVKQRIVRSFDGDGNLVRLRFDHQNDGSFDEEATYTYVNGKLAKETRDVKLDGVIDWVDEHTLNGMIEHVERRNLQQLQDSQSALYSLDHFGSASPQLQDGMHGPGSISLVLYDGRHVGTSPESEGIWDLTRDAQGHLMSGALEARALNFMIPPPNTIAVSSNTTQRWNKQGFVELVELDQERQPGDMPTHVETECSLTPACAMGDVVLPKPLLLLACQPSVLQGQDPGPVEPYVEAPYLLPPFDRIEAIQRRNRYQTRFALEFPSLREIVGY